VGITVLHTRLALILFTPDYQKSVGGTDSEVCRENDLLDGCTDGFREVTWGGIETNYLYPTLHFVRLLLVAVGLLHIVSLIL